MASEPTVVAPLPSMDSLSDPTSTSSLLPSPLPASQLESDASRLKSLKRSRAESSPVSPTSMIVGDRLSPLPKSPRLMERTTPPTTGPPAEQSMPTTEPPASINTAAGAHHELPPMPPSTEPRPHEIHATPAENATSSAEPSMATHAPAERVEMPNHAAISSQHPIDVDGSDRMSALPEHERSNPTSDLRTPQRVLSMPVPSRNNSLNPRSPPQKKHKCPYCETEFTRHHNLKSHLLTHSQEKPYICQTCSMSFRRLHDLKRHTKLHTGERPHICPKCNRKFARGDALARHSKGQGGCAGRRSSMGFPDDEYDGPHGDEPVMDGVIYTDPQDHLDGEPSDDERRRSLPSIKAQLVPGALAEHYVRARGPSTYPPAGPRPSGAGSSLYPPNVDRGSSSSATSPGGAGSVAGAHTPNTSVSSLQLSASGGSAYSQSGNMTESPKPLSPSSILHHPAAHDPTAINRQRSPSHPGQYPPQQHYTARPSGQGSPPGVPAHPANPHKLPTLSALAPPEPKPQYGMSNVGSSPQAPGLYQANAPHHQSSGSGDSSNNLFASGDRGMWTYIQTLEERIKHQSDRVAVLESSKQSQDEKILRLTEEVAQLRQQLGQNHVAAHGVPPRADA